jgi:hypothetical protein
MTFSVRHPTHISLGKPAACRLGRATCSRSPFAKEVFDILKIRVSYAQESATILVAPAGMLPVGFFYARISSTET